MPYIMSKKSDMRMWVPNRVRQFKKEGIDDVGYGGMPSMVETYIRMPDTTLILIDPSFVKKLEPGLYEGVPLYEVRYGNRKGIFGVSMTHGQTPGWVYVVVSSDEQEALKQLYRCLERHLRVRDPYGVHHYPRMIPSPPTRDAMIDAIREVHRRFPVPVMDLFRGSDETHLVYWDRFNFNLHNLVSPTDQLAQLAEEFSKGQIMEELTTMYNVGEQEFGVTLSLKNLRKKGYLTAKENALFMDSYRISPPLQEGSYPKPLITTDVARGMLRKKNSIILFRWNGLYWQAVFFGDFPVNSEDLYKHVPEITPEEVQLLNKKKTSHRYRLVHASSKVEHLEMVEFSMRPRQANKNFMQDFIRYDMPLTRIGTKFFTQSLYYVVKEFFDSGLKTYDFEDVTQMIKELRENSNVENFAVYDSTQSVMVTKKNGSGLSALRELFFTDTYFQSLVLDNLLDPKQYTEEDFRETVLKKIDNLPTMLVAKKRTKRMTGQSKWTFDRVEDSTLWDEDDEIEDKLGPDESLVTEHDGDIAWELFQNEGEFRKVIMKLVLDELVKEKVNAVKIWNVYGMYVSYLPSLFTSLHDFLQDSRKFDGCLQQCGSFNSDIYKDYVNQMKVNVANELARLVDVYAIDSLYF